LTNPDRSGQEQGNRKMEEESARSEELESILKEAVSEKAADIFLVAGLPYSFRIEGLITSRGTEKLLPGKIEELISCIYRLAGRSMDKILKTGDEDFSFSLSHISRFRASIFRQRGSLAAVIRVVAFDLPKPEDLHLPPVVMNVAKLTKGLVLVTGPAGSGKSTSLACMIDQINRTRNAHIITLEDPIEYLHRHIKSVVTQREIYTDTESYEMGLRAALRQAPDIILLGEMRDYETIRTAMTAAETGHLVISTLHTIGAANTIDRLIDSFPAEQQNQIRLQISMVLEMVISQQLVLTQSQTLMPVFEIMVLNTAIRNMIRESKIHQIDSVIASSRAEGMISMDDSLLELFKSGTISKDVCIMHSQDQDLMEKRLQRLS
jgi:twitching motility protein PilT